MLAEAHKRAIDPPASSIHDTQPGIPRPTKPVTIQERAPQPVQVMQPQTVPPPPRYPTTPPPQQQPSRPSTGVDSRVAAPRRSRRRANGGSLWMSAAVGGLIGCGLLTVIVIIAAILISSVQAAAGQESAPTATAAITATVNVQLGEDEILFGSGPAPTLDSASEAARGRLLGTPQPELIATVTPSLAPVGVRNSN